VIDRKTAKLCWQAAVLRLGFCALLGAPSAWADEAPAAGDGDNNVDKSQYTLFNPVPADALRGMDTDRPNITNTPHTIDAGHVQVETGFYDDTHFHNRTQGGNSVADTLTFGAINTRLGLTNNFEINAAISSYTRAKNTDYVASQTTRADGFGDTVIGGKLNLWGNEGSDDAWASGFALQPQIKLPTAQSGLGNNHVEWSLDAPLLVNLVGGFHLGIETSASQERNSANTGYVAGWQNSVSVDRVILGAVDVYLEYAMHATTESHVQPQQSIDVGFTYPVTDNIEIDTGVFIGVNRATPAIEWTSGASFRF
jgi:hypothetical protein